MLASAKGEDSDEWRELTSLGGIGSIVGNAVVAEFVGVKIFALEQTLGLPPFGWNLFGTAKDTIEPLMIGTESIWHTQVALIVLMAHVGGAGTILLFVFLSGSCTAFLSPAWNSSIRPLPPPV